MANGDFEEEFGEWNYLTHMAQHAWKGLPKEVLWEMEADKSGDVDKALDSLIERSEPTDGDALTAYEGGEEIAGDGWDDGDYDDLDYFFIPQEGAALERIFAAIEDGNREQGLSDVGTIVSSTIPLGDLDAGVGAGVQGPPSWGNLYAGANAAYFGPPLDDDLYAGVGAPTSSAPEAGTDIPGSTSIDVGIPGIPLNPPDPGFAAVLRKQVEAYDPEKDPEYDYYFVAAPTTPPATVQNEVTNELTAVLNKVGSGPDAIDKILALIDPGASKYIAGLTVAAILNGLSDPNWEGTAAFRAEVQSALAEWSKKQEDGDKKDEEFQDGGKLSTTEGNWYEDGQGGRAWMSDHDFAVGGFAVSWSLALVQGPPPEKVEDGKTGETILEKLPPPEGAYDVATENLRTQFFTTIYKQSGVGYASQAELDSLNLQTQLLFFLEKGETAWQNLKTVKQDASALEQNYQTYLGEYLTRPFAQRLGPEFYSLVKDVSDIFTKSRETPDTEGVHAADWSDAEEAKKIWVDGLFGEGRDTSRDTLVKLGLTRGGMGYYSRMIHKAAQSQMDYYRDIGLPEEEIFAKMTKRMKKPQVEDWE